jgi:hypothetical protein
VGVARRWFDNYVGVGGMEEERHFIYGSVGTQRRMRMWICDFEGDS